MEDEEEEEEEEEEENFTTKEVEEEEDFTTKEEEEETKTKNHHDNKYKITHLLTLVQLRRHERSLLVCIPVEAVTASDELLHTLMLNVVTPYKEIALHVYNPKSLDDEIDRLKTPFTLLLETSCPPFDHS